MYHAFLANRPNSQICSNAGAAWKLKTFCNQIHPLGDGSLDCPAFDKLISKINSIVEEVSSFSKHFHSTMLIVSLLVLL